jgi:sulfoxide reductase heme-binding subunit YedZ
MQTALALGSNSRALWYLTRGSGMVSLVLLTAVLLLGLVTVTRWSRPGWPRFLTVDLHRNLSILAVLFVAIHVLSAVADTFAPISIVNAFIPFTGSYRPIWLGLGAVGFDLLLALLVSSLLRTRIPQRWWRGVHWLAYLCWPVAVMHGLGTGTDARLGWSQVVTWGSVVAVAGTLVWRLVRDREHPVGARFAGGLTAAVALLGLGGFAMAGPLQPGWAKRAGTPASLLAHSSTVAAAPKGLTSAALQLPYSGTFSGTSSQSDAGDGTTTVVLSGTVNGSPATSLRITLHGQALENGGVAMTSSAVTLAGGNATFSGQVVGLTGNTVTASLTSSSGTRAQLLVSLQISGRSVSGQVRLLSA